MSAVTDTHEERETLTVDVLLPGHDPRVTTSLFTRTRLTLIEREGGRCFVCGGTEQDTGHPLEAHHHPIERSTANMIDWRRLAEDCRAGIWGEHARAFDWEGFLAATPLDPHRFVDDMTVNGMLLCKEHHIGKGEGIHMLPLPLLIAQKYAVEGYQFTPTEIIHHHDKETTK